MKAYSYNGERYGYYGYDASGERTYKYDIFSADSWTNQNGGMNVSLQIDKMMLYPNGYLNINQNGEYTKHYYADALRIASKIGNGFSQDLCTEANQIGNKLDSTYLDERGDRQYVEMKEELSELIHGNQVIDVLPIPYPDTNLCNLSGSGIETALFFYHPDHLGSTGMVTDNSSNITQGFLYAPFGEIITEFNPSWESGRIPKYSFNAKELDEENNMYYYSARYYAPPAFISRDPMFEEKPWMSPYAYCSNSPVDRVDPNGMEDEPIYNLQGDHIGDTKEGFTGTVLIYTGSDDIDFSNMTASEAMQQEGVDTYDNQRANISNVAKSKIWTDIASKLVGEIISGETFKMDDIRYGKIGCDPSIDENSNWVTTISGKKGIKPSVTGTDRYKYETTVENIQSSIVIHEVIGHIKKDYSDEGKTHHLAYKLVINSPLFQKTTAKYQKSVKLTYWDYYETEVGFKK
ncbi:MAG: RHS repeat-associated core domain-containing protein [Ignavibacteria bacterium]|nr:RHS repeat-associated core domain-containing protein [Ignavibacteria bacterium]